MLWLWTISRSNTLPSKGTTMLWIFLFAKKNFWYDNYEIGCLNIFILFLKIEKKCGNWNNLLLGFSLGWREIKSLMWNKWYFAGFSLTTWMTGRGLNPALALPANEVSHLMQSLGVADLLQDQSCDRTSAIYTGANADGWLEGRNVLQVTSWLEVFQRWY